MSRGPKVYELCILHYHKSTIQCATKQCRKNLGPASAILDNFRHGPTPDRCEIVFSFLNNGGSHVRLVCVHTRANTPRCKQAAGYNWIEEVSRLLCPRTYHRVRWGFGLNGRTELPYSIDFPSQLKGGEIKRSNLLWRAPTRCSGKGCGNMSETIICNHVALINLGEWLNERAQRAHWEAATHVQFVLGRKLPETRPSAAAKWWKIQAELFLCVFSFRSDPLSSEDCRA